MIDTDNVKGGYCSKQEMIFYLNAVEEVKRLRERHVAFMQWMIENHDEIVNEWEASE